MKKLWINVTAAVSIGLIIDPAITMVAVAIIVYAMLAFMPLLVEL